MRDIIRRGERVTSLFPAKGETPDSVAPVPGDDQAGKAAPTSSPGAVLEALRARSRAAQNNRSESKVRAEGRPEISSLSDRIRATDAMLAGLRAPPPKRLESTSARPQLQPGGDAIPGLGRALDGNAELLRAQGVRLLAIEKQLDEQTRRLQAALEDLSTRLDKRFDAIERHLASAREHAQEVRTQDQQWIQRRVGRLGRYLVIALCILTLVTLFLFGLNSWRINQGSGRAEGSVRREISGLSGDLSQRLAHLEQDATDTQQGVDRVSGLLSGLNDRIAGLTKAQADLSRRLDAVAPNPPERESAPTQGAVEKADGKTEPAAAPKERYAIQLISFRTKAGVQSFVSFARRFGLKGELRYLKEPDGGKEWYSVLLGDYATYDAAEAAEKGFPQDLKDLKPRIRSIAPGVDLTPIEGE
jgi:hypothetical protein